MTRCTFMVCPHDTASGPERWYRLAQYLTQHLDLEVHFEVSLDFEDFHAQLHTADIVYANPTDTFRLMTQHGFTPLVKPEGLYDELVFVANTDVPNPTLAALHGEQIATVRSLLPSNIALFLLKKQSIEPAELLNRESWLSVIRSVWQGETTYGIVYKDTYDSLSDQGKQMVNVFATSNERVAFHTIVVGRKATEECRNLAQVLLEMHTNDTGREVLQELARFPHWSPITPAEMDLMKHIIEEYA